MALYSFGGVAQSATYYVDYTGGSDSNAGTSAAAPFKRCPGDAAATGTALATTLAAGDTVIFKGGVEYPVELLLKWNGAPGNPITFDGNTAGTFGTGMALFTGADHVTTWTRCTSSADAGGAADWSNCFKAVKSTPWADDPFMVNLFFDGNRAWVARSPNQVDSLYWDSPDVDYAALTTAQLTSTTITFPAGFSPAPVTGQTWPEAWTGNRNTSNFISLRPVASTSADGTVLTLTGSVTPRSSLNSFALFNHARLLDQRGEYILTADSTYGARCKIVFYAGPGGAAPADALVSTKRQALYRMGLDLNEKSHYVIQGIVFTHYAAGVDPNNRNGVGIGNFNKSSASSTDIVIRNCTISNCQNLDKSGAVNISDASYVTVDSCLVTGNQGTRGITMSSGNSVISNNLVTRGGGTGIYTSNADSVQIIGNDVINNSGLHGNGISVYNASTHVTVARNYVVDSNFALTVQASSYVDIYYNVLKHPSSGGSCAMALYGPPTGQPDSAYITVRNNTILGETTKSFRVDDQSGGGIIAGLTVENNIIDGSTANITKITTMNNNLFLSKFVASGLTYIGPNDHYVAGEARPFVNEAGNDFRLASSAPWGINNGVSWTNTDGDLEGNPIIGVRDVGAYEFQSIGSVFGGGKGHSVVLKADGSVWTWGLNDKGQLGNGGAIPGTNTKVPAQLSTISGVISVAGGYQHSLALKADGTVWAWGLNNYGQLGNGTTTNSSTPVQVSSLSGVVAIAAGSHHNFALKSDGTMWGWGRNSTSQIGVGPGADKTTPVQVTAISDVVEMAPGGSHTLVLKSDGTVWGWGYNTSGQLGNGNNSNQSAPVQATGLTNIASIAAGNTHSVAVSATGTVYAWGLNSSGQLADGSTGNRNTPYAWSGVTGVAKAVCGDAYTKVLTTSGNVWGAGSNAQGQLGIGVIGGTYTNPVQITGLTGILDMGSGSFHGLHRKTDGTIAAVGYNLYGQLGDNTNTNRSTPVTSIGIDLD